LDYWCQKKAKETKAISSRMLSSRFSSDFDLFLSVEDFLQNGYFFITHVPQILWLNSKRAGFVRGGRG